MIIFACGLSKSGKTTTLEAALPGQLGVRHIKASDLLKKKSRPVSKMTAADVIPNQRVLVEAVITELAREPAPMLLDGHLLIETIDGPQLVPDECLNQLAIVSVLIIESQPREIVDRRKGTEWAILPEEASDLMEMEAIASRRFARRRGVDWVRLPAGQPDAVRAVLERAGRAQERH